MTTRTFKLIKSPEEVKATYPLSHEEFDYVRMAQHEISRILCGSDSRVVVITGPCSIHCSEGALEYAEKLRDLQEKVKDTMLLVMRFYFEKPRTRTGWKGILYDPHLNGSDDLEYGLEITRRLTSQITKMRVPLASEIVDPIGFYYFDDLLSWLYIGARTTSSQLHRQNTSGMLIPVGYKNDINGSVTNAVHSIVASDTSHTFMGIDNSGRIGVYKSTGCPFAHLVLRGTKNAPNYFSESVHTAAIELENAGLMPSIIIDCSHDNCNKEYAKMPDVFRNVIGQVMDGNDYIRGLMLESNLLSGNQPMDYNPEMFHPGISITDQCIGWEQTEELINWAHQQLSQKIHVYH